MKKILVIGSSNIDFVIRVPYIPSIGETIICSDFTKMLGGKGANQAYACGKLGGITTFLSTVGDDEFGQLIINNINSAGVNTSQIQLIHNIPTGMAIIYVTNEGNNNIVVVPGANNACSISCIEQRSEFLDNSDILLIQMEVPLESVFYAIKKASSLGKLIILDPAPAPDFIPDDIYKCLDFITPNETELVKLTGAHISSLEEVKDACRVLLNKGVKNVLVTLGSKGAILVNDNEETLFSTPDVEVVDTTGAGDTFNAAFAVMLSEGKSFHQSINFANTASSISVSRKGASASIPSRSEVQKFSEQLARRYV